MNNKIDQVPEEFKQLAEDFSKNGFITTSLDNLILTLFFIIFAFGWSPKTSMTEDISSIPIYRKIVTLAKSF